jgi:hypothetical protein
MTPSNKAYILDEFGRDNAMRKPHRGFTRCESGSELWLLTCGTRLQGKKKNTHIKNSNIDEFGRDITLRRPKKPEIPVEEPTSITEILLQQQEEIDSPAEANAREAAEFLKELVNKYKGRSWAELEYEEEEEEEQKIEDEKNKQRKAVDSAREEQWQQGQYDLEEGEIFE